MFVAAVSNQPGQRQRRIIFSMNDERLASSAVVSQCFEPPLEIFCISMSRQAVNRFHVGSQRILASKNTNFPLLLDDLAAQSVMSLVTNDQNCVCRISDRVS